MYSEVSPFILCFLKKTQIVDFMPRERDLCANDRFNDKQTQ